MSENNGKNQFEIGDWIFVELKGSEHLGFSVMKLDFDHSVEYYNSRNCPHKAVKIMEEQVNRMRKELS